MTIRESLEIREQETLSPYASQSSRSRGRSREEPQCDIRTVYQRDRDRILHSKSFRRLKHKTQVFLSPEGDHYRTRLTHTLEVAQISRTVAKALRLNEDLTEAIALGHDLGHTPFGHSGEDALDRAVAPAGLRFRHYLQSVRIVEYLEKDGEGLNLTWEVRDGILNHGTKGKPFTLEGKIVRICDKIAYINHDIDDAIRGQVLTEDELPQEYTDILGHSVRSRLNRLIHDVVTNSMDKPDIIQSPEVGEAMLGLREFMFRHVYKSNIVKQEEAKAKKMLQNLFDYYMDHMEILPPEYLRMLAAGEPKEVVVCDYIAGMTDQYAVAKFEEFFVPRSWNHY